MSRSESIITFSVGASNAGAVETFNNIGKELDKLADKQNKLAKGPATAASDRKINKALSQDSAGDFLELFGLTEESLGFLKKVGIGLAIFDAAAVAVTKTLNGIREGKAASEIWTDIAKGIPILGGVAKAADDAGKAIGEFYYDLDAVKAKGKLEDDAIVARNKLIADSGKSGKEARDALYVAGAADKDVAQQQLNLRDTLASTGDQRKKILGLGKGGISNEARDQALKDLADVEAVARKKLVDAELAAQKKIDDAKQDAFEKEKKRKDDLAEKAKKAAEDQLKQDSDLQDRIFEKQISVENQIAEIEARKEEEKTQRMIELGKQMRTGALAETAGIGTANQLASRERASNNPMVKLAEEQNKKADKQVEYLKGILDLLNQGTDPASIFGL